MRTSGNTVLITGGGSGIGFELARQLQALGNTVIITGRDQARLDAAKKLLPQVHAFKSDVSDPKAIAALQKAVTKQFPALNVLVNNAGVMRKIDLHAGGDGLDDLTQEVAINLEGPIRMVQAFLPHLKAQPAAAIINVTSGLALVPLPIAPVYCATKAGLRSYTQSLRVQLKRTAVGVFELAPPLTQTELLGTFDPQDMKGVPAMPVATLVKAAIRGLAKDQREICPASSNMLRWMGRLAPGLGLAMLSGSVDPMLDHAKA